MPRVDNNFCGACGEFAKDCQHPNGSVEGFIETLGRWNTGVTCWPSWREKDEYRQYIAELMGLTNA